MDHYVTDLSKTIVVTNEYIPIKYSWSECDNEAAFVGHLASLLQAGKKIFVFANSKGKLDKIFATLAKHVDDFEEKSKKYTKDTGWLKQGEDINVEWAKYQCVGFTPLCLYGVSYDNIHAMFDLGFAYLTNVTTTVIQSMQALRRVRHLADGHLYVLFRGSTSIDVKSYPEFVEMMNKNSREVQKIVTNELRMKTMADLLVALKKDAPSYAPSIDRVPGYIQDLYLQVAYDAYISKHAFRGFFRKVMATAGYYIRADDCVEMCERELGLEKVEVDYFNVPDITDEDVTEYDAAMRNGDPCQGMYHAYMKYQMKKMFNVHEMTGKEESDLFVKFLRSPMRNQIENIHMERDSQLATVIARFVPTDIHILQYNARLLQLNIIRRFASEVIRTQHTVAPRQVLWDPDQVKVMGRPLLLMAKEMSEVFEVKFRPNREWHVAQLALERFNGSRFMSTKQRKSFYDHWMPGFKNRHLERWSRKKWVRKLSTAGFIVEEFSAARNPWEFIDEMEILFGNSHGRYRKDVSGKTLNAAWWAKYLKPRPCALTLLDEFREFVSRTSPETARMITNLEHVIPFTKVKVGDEFLSDTTREAVGVRLNANWSWQLFRGNTEHDIRERLGVVQIPMEDDEKEMDAAWESFVLEVIAPEESDSDESSSDDDEQDVYADDDNEIV